MEKKTTYVIPQRRYKLDTINEMIKNRTPPPDWTSISWTSPSVHHWVPDFNISKDAPMTDGEIQYRISKHKEKYDTLLGPEYEQQVKSAMTEIREILDSTGYSGIWTD